LLNGATTCWTVSFGCPLCRNLNHRLLGSTSLWPIESSTSWWCCQRLRAAVDLKFSIGGINPELSGSHTHEITNLVPLC
jgi:hypothetical protein